MNTKPMQVATMRTIAGLRYQRDEFKTLASTRLTEISDLKHENETLCAERDLLQKHLETAREVALVWKDAASTTWLNNGKASALIDRALQLNNPPSTIDTDLKARGYLKEARTLLFKSPENGK